MVKALASRRLYPASVQACRTGGDMTVAKPSIELIGTNGQNIWSGRGVAKLAIVNHIMSGSMAGCISWFRDPAAQASSNYGVGRDGRIVCFVDPFGSDAPFANGLVNQPSAAAQALITRMGGMNPNYWTVSKEHEGQSGDVMPPAQLAASAQLTAWLCEQFAIPFDEDHDLGHYEFDNVTRHNCPGWNRQQWIDYEAAVDAFLSPVPVPVPPPPGPNPLEARVAVLEEALKVLKEGLVHAGS